MDADHAAFINLLATKIGIVIEDTAPIALSMKGLHREDLKARCQQIIEASAQIMAFASALDTTLANLE